METNFHAKSEFAVEDPTVKIRHQCPRTFVVLLVVINILTIVFGCALIVKMTTLLNISNEMDEMRAQLDEYRNQFSRVPEKHERVPDKVTRTRQAIQAANNATEEELTALPNTQDEMGMDKRILDLLERVQTIEAAFNATDSLTVVPNVEDEIENMRGRLDEGENLISQIVENVTGADQQVIDMMKRTQAIETAINVLEQKMTTLPGIQDEMGKMQGRLDQDEKQVLQLAENFTGTDKQVLNMIQRTQTIEAANDEFKKRVSESLERTKIMGRVVWKFDKYNESTIARLGSQGSKVYYGPTFYTSPLGYRMQLTCTLKAPKSIDASIMIMRGEYDNLLKWPFSGKVTFIIFDQSQQQKNVNNSLVAVSEKSGACWSTWQRPLGNAGQTSPCAVQMLTNNHIESGNYIKYNTLLLGVEVESYNSSIRIV